MGRGATATRTSSFVLGILSMLVVVGPAAAQDPAEEMAGIRFVHAVQGAGEAEVSAGGADVGSAGYGEATDSIEVPAGRTKLEVTLPDGAELAPSVTLPDGAALASSETLEAGESYTAVALHAETEGGIEVRFFPDGDVRGGEARVNGAPGGDGAPRGDDGPSWLLVMLAAVAAGMLGGGVGNRVARRPSSPGRG